jgi:hypothetical protein
MWIHTVEHFVLHWDTAGQSVGYSGTLLESTSTPRDNCCWYKNISMSISLSGSISCVTISWLSRAHPTQQHTKSIWYPGSFRYVPTSEWAWVQERFYLCQHYLGFGGWGKLELEFPRSTYEPVLGSCPWGLARWMEDVGGWWRPWRVTS